MLWELLTGRRALAPGRRLEGAAPALAPPSSLVPRLPPAWTTWCMTALAPNPDDRYASAEAFAARLTALMSAAQDASRLKAFLAELFESDEGARGRRGEAAGRGRAAAAGERALR
jgi:hypothetical protein